MEEEIKELVTIVADSKQIRDLHPEIFEEVSFEETPLYLEKAREDEEFKKDDRIFLFGSGVLFVSTLDLEYLWNMSVQNSKDLLHELAKYSSSKSVRREEIQSYPDFEKKIIEGREFYINYYAYKNQDSSEKLYNVLEKRVK